MLEKKAILISIDGMRADAIGVCGSPFLEKMQRLGLWSLEEKAVVSSVTLPCHMSMTHSIHPERE